MPVFGVFLVCIFPDSVRLRENMGQKNSEYIHFLSSVSADYWVWLSWDLLTYDNAANLGLPQRDPSSQLFWLTHFWVNNIQLPSYYEKSAKTNKNWPIITKILNLIFGGKSYLELPWSRRDAAAHQRLSNITELVSKLIGVKSKIHWGLPMIPYFCWGELSFIILSRR